MFNKKYLTILCQLHQWHVTFRDILRIRTGTCNSLRLVSISDLLQSVISCVVACDGLWLHSFSVWSEPSWWVILMCPVKVLWDRNWFSKMLNFIHSCNCWVWSGSLWKFPVVDAPISYSVPWSIIFFLFVCSLTLTSLPCLIDWNICDITRLLL